MLAQVSKLVVFSVLALVLADASYAAPAAKGRAREKDRAKTTAVEGRTHQMGGINAKGQREAYVNNLYYKLQNRELAQVLQEVYLRPEKVDNDAAAIQGVEKFVDLIQKYEATGKTADEAVELALRELRPDLKLTSKDLLEACR